MPEPSMSVTTTAHLNFRGNAREALAFYQATSLWTALSDGATIIQPLAPADWAPAYGMLTDRFGVTWIFGIAPAA
jgi:uncharacterized glyoxalase superfamily protein PhnB